MRKLNKYIEETKVPEWNDFYINVSYLCEKIKPIYENYKYEMAESINKDNPSLSKKVSRVSKDTRNSLIVSQYKELKDLTLKLNDNSDEEEDIRKINNSLKIRDTNNFNVSLIPNISVELLIIEFRDILISELNKVYCFYYENYKYCVYRLKKYSDHLNFIKEQNKIYKDENNIKDKKDYVYIKEKEQLEVGLKELYKEIKLMYKFIEINFNCEKVIKEKLITYTECILNEKALCQLTEHIDKYSILIITSKYYKLYEFQNQITKIYMLNFYHDHKFEICNILETYGNIDQTINSKHFFFFGFYFAALLIIIILSIIISNLFEIDVDTDREFSRLFPLFRGQIVICLFLWLNSINVYLFNKFGVNYRLVLNFDNHYSDFANLLSRSAVYSSIVSISILYYLLLRTKIIQEYLNIEIIERHYIPLIGWIFIIIYLVWPYKNLFNYRGRVYVYRIIWNAVTHLCTETSSLFIVGNLVSMSVIIRDFVYIPCFYINLKYLNTEEWYCQETNRLIHGISFLPPLCLMCLIVMKRIRNIPNTYIKTIVRLRFVFVFITIISSYSFTNKEKYWVIWLVSAIWTSLFSFYWDVKQIYGFGNMSSKNFLLRDKLALKPISIYYILLFIDFIFRFSFVLIISPQIVYHFLRPEYLLMWLYFSEIARRAIYNFMMIENCHAALCDTFRATKFIPSPFQEDNETGKLVLKSELEQSPAHEIDKIDVRLKIIKEKATDKSNWLTAAEYLELFKQIKLDNIVLSTKMRINSLNQIK